MDKYQSLFMPGAVLGAGALLALAIFTTGGIQVSSQEGGLAGTGNPAGGQGAAAPQLELTITEDDHIRGNVDAPITIVEYSDFECPFCQRFHPTVLQALNEYGDDIRWVYRHFPLANIHPQAIPSAEASECVAEQAGDDGFWQFADAMFENQSRLAPSFYREVAQQIGVNIEQYDSCVTSRKFEGKVSAQMQDGINLGITGTPGGFVNNTPVRGALPYANLKSIIDSELQNI